MLRCDTCGVRIVRVIGLDYMHVNEDGSHYERCYPDGESWAYSEEDAHWPAKLTDKLLQGRALNPFETLYLIQLVEADEAARAVAR
jgi:hypothetical protein